MHSLDWIQLYHHTASPLGSAAPTFGDLLQLARGSNYAQLVDHHFWPLPVLQQENIQLHQALTDLVSNIWNFLATLNYQSLLLTSHQANMIIEVDRDDHSRSDGYLRTQPHGSSTEHASSKCDYPTFSGDYCYANPGPSLWNLQAPDAPLEDLIEAEDCTDQLRTIFVAEETSVKVVGEDPTAIYALQAQIFNSADHTDNILQTGNDLKVHLRTASLNVNGLLQQKLPIILTYIKKKKVDILTIQVIFL